ncbi:MAG: thioredoxin-dependent thiol peroxidase [Saprospiraceae bacterium]
MESHLPQFKLKEGDLFPNVILKNQNGVDISIQEINIDFVVLFFYPEDNTPTCTKEACGIRDNFEVLEKYNCKVFGVSPDNEKSHRKFISNHQLNYDLLVDEDHKLASELGIWGMKFTFGRAYAGLHRVSYVLNKSKKIHKIIYPVESAIHTQQIIDCLH